MDPSALGSHDGVVAKIFLQLRTVSYYGEAEELLLQTS